jgi:glycosyltransferase involved in cell wall biosynthesis
MKNLLKITVVIPLFNKAAHVGRAVRSALDQTHRDFEIIVVNDGSTDGGAEAVKRMDDSRIFIIDQENAGVSAARNRGIDAARGELVAFLDADDQWGSDFLATIIRLNRMFPQAGLYATAYQIVQAENRMFNPGFKGLPSSPWEGLIPSYFRSAALGAPPVCASAACVPKRIVDEVGGFPLGRRMGEDLDLWGRIALRYPVAFSTQYEAVYYQDADNRACTIFNLHDEHPFFETAKNARRMGGISEALRDDVELYIARLGWENMRQHVLAGNVARARELANELESNCMFTVRRMLWGSKLNSVTRIVWQLANSLH